MLCGLELYSSRWRDNRYGGVFVSRSVCGKMIPLHLDREEAVNRVLRRRVVPRRDCVVKFDYVEGGEGMSISLYELRFICRCLFLPTNMSRYHLEDRLKKCCVARGTMFPLSIQHSLLSYTEIETERTKEEPSLPQIDNKVASVHQESTLVRAMPESFSVPVATDRTVLDYGANLYQTRTFNRMRLTEYRPELLRSLDMANEYVNPDGMLVSHMEREMGVCRQTIKRFKNVLKAETSLEEDRKIVEEVFDWSCKTFEERQHVPPDCRFVFTMEKYGYEFQEHAFIHLISGEPFNVHLTWFQRLCVRIPNPWLREIDSESEDAPDAREVYTFRHNPTKFAMVFSRAVLILLIVVGCIVLPPHATKAGSSFNSTSTG